MKLGKEEEMESDEMGMKRNWSWPESSTKTRKDFADDGYAGPGLKYRTDFA